MTTTIVRDKNKDATIAAKMHLLERTAKI